MEASDAIEGVTPGRDEGEIQGRDAVMEHEAPELTKINSVGFDLNRFQELVGDVPNDFEAWASLIAHVEKAHPNDIERICLIYDAFLSEYPLCYGYWNKYANHKAQLCTLHEVEETYERAVLAVPYSVDIWVKYCSFGALTYEDPMDIRRLYERGLSFVKKDYFCHQLWDKYIEYEYSIQQWSHLAHLHIRTLVFPTKKLQSYYERFKKLVDIWSQKMGCQQDLELPRESISLSQGMTDIKDNEYLEISNLIKEFMDQKGDHSKMAFRKYLSLGDQLYNRSRQIDEKIYCFEAQIRRRYFHPKPLDACQIDNWHQYLDFAEMQGDFDWTVKLYERCLIACASYSEFWVRYVEFVDANGGREIANDALWRGLTIFLKRVPAFHIYSAMFKEKIGDFSAARTLVKQGLDLGSDFIVTVKKQANMEKRLGNTEVACQTYEKAIELATENRNFDIIPSLYYNFAQFTFAASGSIDAARGVFVKGFQQAPCRAILEGLINFTTIHGSASEIPIIDVIIMNALEPGSSVFQALSDQDREDISSLFVEFVDLYGDIHDVRKAWDRHRKLFPHIMDLSANHASSENSTVNKSMNAGNGPAMDLICNGCIVNSNLARDRQQTTNLPVQSSYDILEEVDVTGKLNLEINRTGTQEIQLTDAKIMEQSVKRSGSHNVANEQVHETHETNPQCSKIEDNHEPNFDDLRRLPSLDNLSLKSPNVNNLPVISTTLIDSELSEEVITVGSSSKVQHGEDAVEASEVHVPVILDRKSSSSSHPDQYNESYSFQATGSPAIEAQLKFHQQFNPQSQSNSKHELPPNTIASPQIASGGGSWAQNNKRKQNPEDATSPDGHIQIQVSEHQNCQVQEEAQYPLGGNSSQLPPDQFHPYQSQAWSNTQAPQASQTQVLYQMAAAQAYQTTNLAWTGQTMQHQGLVYVQSQPSSQPASQTQTYAYQQLNQNSEQYGYTQSGQVFNPQIWQYYQQQLYYLQQQQQQQWQQQSQPQNQLTPNSSDLLSQAEHVQQQEEKKSQQMPTRSQQLVIQLQRKQNQKTNQQVHEHASSPEQQHNQPHQLQQQALQLQQQDEQANQTQHEQQASQLQQQNGQANQTQHQQQASHIQQQNEQANQTQQQLLYLQHQQQQQQIYMQQQQLYLQQLYQQQLFQQQQQQVPQQLQQYQLFQLQQQLFQLQQQQQPTIGTSEVQVQQGEESKSQKVEQPERSHSSTPQRTPTH